jgi:hypothetical protein
MRSLKVFESSLLRGHSFLLTMHCEYNGLQEHAMSVVSHLLHTRQPGHLRTLLYKLGNVEGEALPCLVYLDGMLPRDARPDAVVLFLQPL